MGGADAPLFCGLKKLFAFNRNVTIPAVGCSKIATLSRHSSVVLVVRYLRFNCMVCTQRPVVCTCCHCYLRDGDERQSFAEGWMWRMSPFFYVTGRGKSELITEEDDCKEFGKALTGTRWGSRFLVPLTLTVERKALIRNACNHNWQKYLLSCRVHVDRVMDKLNVVTHVAFLFLLYNSSTGFRPACGWSPLKASRGHYILATN